MRTFLIPLRLLILAAILSSSLPATAQPGLTNQGRDFWIGFMPNTPVPATRIRIHVATEVPNRIKVQTYGPGDVIVRTQTITLGAHQSTSFDMSVSLSETSTQEVTRYGAIHVTATSPCTVSGLSDNSLSSESYLALPLPFYGKEYYCLSYYDDYYYFIQGSHLGGEFLVVAPYDDTKVTIRTAAQTTISADGKKIGHDSGAVWTVTLAKGQTYLVESTGWHFGVGDLTGSHITSTKPVAFITGHKRAQIETTGDNSKDHLIEMIPPTDRWGTEYIGVPQPHRISGNYYRVLSAEPGNVIAVSGIDTTLHLDAGEFAALHEVKQAVKFTSINAKRFIVMQYGYYQFYGGDPGIGDPSMVMLVPNSSFTRSVTFALPQTEYPLRHYATIVSTAEGLEALTVREGEKAPVSLSAFSPVLSPIAEANYSSAIFELDSVATAWTVTSSQPFSLKLLGVGQLSGYAQLGGVGFSGSTDSISPSYKLLSSDVCGNITLRLSDQQGIADIFPVGLTDRELFGAPGFTENITLQLDSTFRSGDTASILTIHVTDPVLPASLELYVLDRNGNDTTYSMSFEPKAVEWVLDAPFPAVTRVGDTTCSVVTLRNLHSDSVSVKPSSLDPASGFQLTPIDLVRLGPGDSMKFDLCFMPKDTLTYSDSIRLSTECYVTGFLASARAAVGKIYALDRQFGSQQPNVKTCMDIQIINQGELPIVVTGFEHTGDSAFTVLAPSFPFLLSPGAKQDATICFLTDRDTGHFEARFTWLLDHPTDLNKPYTVVNASVAKSDIAEYERPDMMLWPNPADAIVMMPLAHECIVREVRAVNLLGVSQQLPVTQSNGFATIIVNGLRANIYTLLIETSQGRYARQLVIDR